jgi:hypothetical protein
MHICDDCCDGMPCTPAVSGRVLLRVDSVEYTQPLHALGSHARIVIMASIHPVDESFLGCDGDGVVTCHHSIRVRRKNVG